MGANFSPKIIWQSNTSINKAGKHIFRRFHDFRGINLAFLLWDLVIMLLYDMKFRITSFDMNEPPHCVLYFPMYFLLSTQKTETNFKILQSNPYFDY